MPTSASERARRCWNKEPLSFSDIDQLPTREAKAAAFVARYEHLEKLERAKRRPNERLLAEIAAKKQALQRPAAPDLAVSPPGEANTAPVIQINEAATERARPNHESRKDRER